MRTETKVTDVLEHAAKFIWKWQDITRDTRMILVTTVDKSGDPKKANTRKEDHR